MNATPTFSLMGEANDKVITAMTNAAHFEAMHTKANPLRQKATPERRRDNMRTSLADMMSKVGAEPVDQKTFEGYVDAAQMLEVTFRAIMTEAFR